MISERLLSLIRAQNTVHKRLGELRQRASVSPPARHRQLFLPEVRDLDVLEDHRLRGRVQNSSQEPRPFFSLACPKIGGSATLMVEVRAVSSSIPKIGSTAAGCSEDRLCIVDH